MRARSSFDKIKPTRRLIIIVMFSRVNLFQGAVKKKTAKKRPNIRELDREEQQHYENNNDNNDNNNFDIGESYVFKEFMKLDTGFSIKYYGTIYERDYPGDTEGIITAIKNNHTNHYPNATYINPIPVTITEELDAQQTKYDNEEFES